MARALGKDSAADAYDRLSARVRTAFDGAYVEPDGRVGAPFLNPDSVRSEFTQTAYVLALRFGLVPDSLRARAVRHLADDIAAHGWHLTTGFLGSAYVLPVLSEGGRDDVAFRLLLQETFPSWLYEVKHGATTTWERWNGDHGDPGMNSYSHYAFGAVGEWLYRYLAGIDEAPGSVGFGAIEIRPRWAAPFAAVRAVYRSPRGTIASAWRRLGNGAIEVTVTIPANTSGRVILPSGPQAIEAGTYRFTVR
jgi:alpha-L-rhamnosidase